MQNLPIRLVKQKKKKRDGTVLRRRNLPNILPPPPDGYFPEDGPANRFNITEFYRMWRCILFDDLIFTTNHFLLIFNFLRRCRSIKFPSEQILFTFPFTFILANDFVVETDAFLRRPLFPLLRNFAFVLRFRMRFRRLQFLSSFRNITTAPAQGTLSSFSGEFN